MEFFYSISLKLLRFFPAEFASKISLNSLKFLFKFSPFVIRNKKKYSNIHFKYENMHFKNYLGIAAGLDKEGIYFPAIGSLGFGFVEVGTFTPQPQKGNEYPRLKRIIESESLINRLGFNNPGILKGSINIEKYRNRYSGILGVSIGKNKQTKLEDAYKDYIFCLNVCYGISDYIAINISSPNTEGLRELSNEVYFNDLLSQINISRNILIKKFKKKVPLFLKLSPDESEENLDFILNKSIENNISGFIVSNTMKGKYGGLEGGISGEKLKKTSLNFLKKVNSVIKKDALLISSGGISSKKDIEERMDNGADLMQIYTSFVYKGPSIINELLN
ncbi:dihydroorotate dehydrogenase (quinone) [SAR86 cluster bacterium]|nr:dihydroorotate dehydrogenase (quinone) [SAR86 cluster bacterium]